MNIALVFSRRIIFILLLIFTIIIWVWWYYWGLTPYIPVIIEEGNNRFIYDKSLLDSQHIEDICKTFDFYNVYYMRKGNQVFIRRYLFRDMDLLANYTDKAKNQSYLKTFQRATDSAELKRTKSFLGIDKK